MSEYTQAVCHDGAAILKDGVPLTVEQILEALRERDEYRNHLAVIAEMTGNAGDIGATHEGVNALVEDLARHKRLFAATCQQLGSIQQAMGSTVVGIEPALVQELVVERDALAAHVERLKAAAISAYEACDEQQESDEFSRCVIIRDAVWSKLELLNQLATDDENDYTAELARRYALKQAEALEICARQITHDDSREWIRCASKKLRKQAEGHQ